MKFSASGIVESEWQVALGIFILVGLTYNWQYKPQILSQWRYESAIWLIGYVLLMLLTTLWMIPGANNPLPVDRADWFWLLGLLILTQLIRWFVTRRLWPRTLLDLCFISFILLVIISSHFAPFASRGIGMAGRPVLGFAIVIHLMNITCETGSLSYAVKIAVGLCILIGVITLTMTQWNEKSDALAPIINLLPQFNRIFVSQSINPNEIGGGSGLDSPFICWLDHLPLDIFRSSLAMVESNGTSPRLLAGFSWGKADSQ